MRCASQSTVGGMTGTIGSIAITGVGSNAASGRSTHYQLVVAGLASPPSQKRRKGARADCVSEIVCGSSGRIGVDALRRAELVTDLESVT